MAKFTHRQAANGGRTTQRRRVPFDPADLRVYPLLPNTWEASCIWVDRVMGRWEQYDIVTTRNQRTKLFLRDGIELPVTCLTEFFEALRAEKSMPLLKP